MDALHATPRQIILGYFLFPLSPARCSGSVCAAQQRGLFSSLPATTSARPGPHIQLVRRCQGRSPHSRRQEQRRASRSGWVLVEQRAAGAAVQRCSSAAVHGCAMQRVQRRRSSL